MIQGQKQTSVGCVQEKKWDRCGWRCHWEYLCIQNKVGRNYKLLTAMPPGCIADVVYREWMRCSLPDLWKGKLWSPSRDSSSSCTDVVTFPSARDEGRCFPIWREPAGNVSLMHSTVLRQNFPRDWAKPMNQYHWKLIKTIILIKYKGTRSSQYSGSN